MTKKLKDIIKKNPEPARGKVGVDPTNPWSAKSNLAEGSLDQYLLARGINPKFVSTQTKISHAKSSAFLKWKQDHQFESVELTEADKADIISLDIPLMIRMLELAREDVKDDMELHRITERLIEIRSKGTLTMDDYDFIAGIKKLKEEIEEIAEKKMSDPCWKGYQAIGMKDKNGKKVPNCVPEETELEEGRMKDLATDASETQRLNKMSTLQKFRADSTARAKKHSDIEKNSGGMTSAIDRLEKHLNKEDVVNEMDKTQDAPGRDADYKLGSKEYTGKPVKAKKFHASVLKSLNKAFNKTTSENTLDPMAATEAPCDGANGGETNSPSKKSQMSKSARMIKSLYKHLNMKEETYDWEKDDKAQDNGKKPKISVPDAKKSMGEQKPEARVVMSGGTTMTGEKRDTVEIDPLMKNRAGPPDSFTKEQGKKGQ